VLIIGGGFCLASSRCPALFLQTVAGDLLETVRKTESSLKRLKKHRGAGDAPAEGAASDTEKMTTQLFLDVQVHGAPAAKAVSQMAMWTASSIRCNITSWQCC
jgi:Domain of unknown function (DUF3510)